MSTAVDGTEETAGQRAARLRREKRADKAAGEERLAKIKQLNKLELHILICTWTTRGARGFERALVPFVQDLQDHGVKVDGEVQPYRRDSRRNTEMYSGWKCDFARVALERY